MPKPWTREQLNALKRLTGQGRAPMELDGERATDLYRNGWSYADIAARFGCARTTVRKHLAARGVEARPRGKPARTGLSPLAREILADLKGPLNGATTVPVLIDWLGETRASLTPALEQLRDRGLVREAESVFALAGREVAPRLRPDDVEDESDDASDSDSEVAA